MPTLSSLVSLNIITPLVTTSWYGGNPPFVNLSVFPSIPDLLWKSSPAVVLPTQNTRHQRLQKFCGNTSVGRGYPNQLTLRFLLVDHRHHVVYCYIPKVACSSWKLLMARLAGSNRTLTPLSNHEEFLQSLGIPRMFLIPKQDRQNILHDYSTFMFVRHPFDRLVSAYVNKFKMADVVYHKKYGCQIIKLFRANSTKGDLQKCNDVTFQEFVKYVIHLYRTDGSFDPHWRPFHELCDPCHVPYDFIGKMETMSMDKSFVMRNFFKTTVLDLPKVNPKDDDKPYMAEISPEDKDILYDIYKQDFLLFGYDKEVWNLKNSYALGRLTLCTHSLHSAQNNITVTS